MAKPVLFALYSRILVIAMQVFFNNLMPDHKADAFDPPSDHDITTWDFIVQVLFGGLKRWDGIYFQHIAEFGYTYENSLAFFPLFPLTVRALSCTVLYPLEYIMNPSSVLLVAAVLVNIVCFLLSAAALEKLGKQVLQNERLAYKAVLLFCINPASIFFTAPYSESMFSMFLFMGLLNCQKGQLLKGSIFIGLASLTRSNGVVAVGFIVYYKLQDSIKNIRSSGKCVPLKKSESKQVMLSSIIRTFVIPTLFYIGISLVPFCIYQYYAYRTFCLNSVAYKDIPQHISKYGHDKNYKMPYGRPSPWCRWNVPLSYSHVQKSHWNVGFLEYYEIKQIPNFLLAAPMIIISLSAVYSYITTRPAFCQTLGLVSNIDDEVDYKKTDSQDTSVQGFHVDGCFVHIGYMAFLTLFGIFFMHVQVITRFVASSCPVLYWFIADITSSKEDPSAADNINYNSFGTNQTDTHRADDNSSTNQEEQSPNSPNESSFFPDDIMNWENQDFTSKMIYTYFHFYFFVGAAAFSNFLPWT